MKRNNFLKKLMTFVTIISITYILAYSYSAVSQDTVFTSLTAEADAMPMCDLPDPF